MAEKVRVGVLYDTSDGPSGNERSDTIRRAIEAVRAEGRLDAEVEVVEEFGLGLPSGTAEAVREAFDKLVAQDVLLIVGPAIGDNALLATPWADAVGIPMINWAGAERARSEYMFHLQVGSHEDESLVMARHMKSIGATRLGVVYDQSPIGTRHLEYLESEADLIGIEIVATADISPVAETGDDQVAKVLGSQPDGFVYLGLGLSAPGVARALTASGWTGPRIMNTAGLRGYGGEFAQVCNNWIYIDMHSDSNQALIDLCERESIPKQGALWAALSHDLAVLTAEGLARANELTRDGVKHGLEQIKWIPAAEGHDGTLLGFGIQDRGALHGRYLVVRQWVDGKTLQVDV